MDELAVQPPPSEDEVWPLEERYDSPMVVPATTFDYYVELHDKYPLAVGGWQDCDRERRVGQAAAVAHDREMRTLLRESRAGQVRYFVAGAGVGAAVTTCVLVGIAAALDRADVDSEEAGR